MTEPNPEWEVSVHEVKRMLDTREDLALVDVREVDEHGIARIEGAQLVPLSVFASRLGDLEARADERMVILCHHGQRSLQAAVFLREQGFADVKSMAGGIDAWSRAIDPTVPRY